MLFLRKNANAVDTIAELLSHFKIPVTKKTIFNELKIHPDYPSLLALSDVLRQFGIANEAYSKVSMEQLPIIPCPFIVHTKNQGSQFMLVKSITDTHIQLNKITVEINEFKEKFDGTILVLEALDSAGDPNYKENKRAQYLNSLRNPIAIVGLVVIMLSTLLFHTSYFKVISWQLLTITLFKAIGIITSVLLLIQSVNANNPLIQQLCHGDTNKNCNAILSSKAAKVFDWLSWSEVGYFYFAGSFLAFLFNTDNTAILQILALLNIFSLPYTFYSIYHQGWVAKQWCMFCSTIQVLLWLEFFPLLTYLTHPLTFPNLSDFSSIFVCFLIPFIIWIWVKPFLLETQKIDPLNKQINKFKYNIELFNRLLTDQPKYTSPDADWTVVMGNEENPDKIITMVSNPYCNPCTRAHKVLNELLASKNNIQVRFIFMFTKISDDDKRMVVARQLLALDESQDKSVVHKAMKDWYEERQKDFPTWSSTYPATNNNITTQKLEKQRDWLNLTEITSTPTILIDGYKLPYPYDLKDLKYF